MTNRPATEHKRPFPSRPKLGWLAWEVTLGYMCAQHSPDALLKLETAPFHGTQTWNALISWSQNTEVVENQPNLAAALRNLWQVVNNNHIIFKNSEMAVKQPTGYEDNQWLDERAQEIMDRLIQVTQTVFVEDWSIVMVYQPVQSPNIRVQARLLARANTVQVGGFGPTLRDACANLYHNAARVYAQYSRRKDE